MKWRASIENSYAEALEKWSNHIRMRLETGMLEAFLWSQNVLKYFLPWIFQIRLVGCFEVIISGVKHTPLGGNRLWIWVW